MFSHKSIGFLVENRMQNNRDWFLEHKGEYNEYVLQPLAELAVDLGPVVSSIDSEIIIEPKVDRTISRIYRDTRFSKDKMLYRDAMWLSFRRDKKAFPNYPEFFFVVMPNEFIYGCGYYAAPADVMNEVRKLILAGDPVFKRALEVYESQSEFFIDGDKYKRSKYPDQPENLREWLDRKGLCFMCRSNDFNLLYSKGLANKIGGVYKQMDDIYKFFISAENIAERK